VADKREPVFPNVSDGEREEAVGSAIKSRLWRAARTLRGDRGGEEEPALNSAVSVSIQKREKI